MRLVGLALVLILALSVACGSDETTAPAVRTPTLDQVFEPGAANAIVGFATVGAWAQTFTVGLTGTLSSVDLILSSGPTADDVIRVDIRGTTAGNPNLDDGAVLGSRLVSGLGLPENNSSAFVRVDFSAQNIPVIAGQRLAIVLMRVVGTGGSDVLWITENQPEDYLGGNGVQRNGGTGAAWTPLVSDFYFRTHVQL
jgi:hypothetical protein